MDRSMLSSLSSHSTTPEDSNGSTNAPNSVLLCDNHASHPSSDQELFPNMERDALPALPSGDCISFRPLHEGDRDQIQDLHEEWFPVRYKSEFYDELVRHRMVNSGEHLFTCAAIYHEEDPFIKAENHECSRLVGAMEDVESDEDLIAGCIVGSFVMANRLNKDTMGLLVSDVMRFTKLFYIMTVGVITEFRHRELGSTLVKKVISVVEQDNDCGAIYLHVITHNSAAIRFYEKLGFFRVKEIKDYYKIEGKTYNCYLYARYFHGNRGQRDFFHLASTYLSLLWKQLTGASIFPGIQPASRRPTHSSS